MKKRTIWILAALVVLLFGVIGAYTAIGMHYSTHFFEHTTINGIDVSELTVEAAEALIAGQAEDYRITVTTRENTQEVIEGADIGYRFVSQNEVQTFLDEQNIFAWLPAFFGAGSSYSMDASMTYDESLLKQAVLELDCMDAEKMTKPQDAYVEKQENGSYAIVPEVEGNELDASKVISLIKERVEHGASGANLEEADCYVKPAVLSDDGALRAEAAVMNRYSSMVITYQMGGGVTEILDWGTLEEWFSLDESGQPAFDRAAAEKWVDNLADTYDTIGTYPAFVTSNGETVYPEARTYGWQMDRDAEKEALYNLLLAGESSERSPVWLESAAARGQNDIGDTYVEIDYTNQRMWYYKDGALLVETPVVTGNVSNGDASPEGIFCIVYKEENAVLKGEDYETPVDYWMPFYGGVGIHDADTWRSTYGGDIYQWGGSHGCINTPTAQAAIIFQNIEAGTPVVCYSSGINYGYSQITVSGAGTGVSDQTGNNTQSGVTDGDIVIIDGGNGTVSAESEASASDEVIIDVPSSDGDAWTGESAAGEGTEEFPITIQDAWSGEQVIY